MAAQSESTAPPSAQIVGNAFVEQYYHILHKSPELVHRFYQDSSSLSRPRPDGLMTTVTTMQGINEQILSLDYNNYKVEIFSADAQNSYKDGVVVLVTGCLTGKDDVRRKFTQSFFLAPQENVNQYFVLNDIFRYVGDHESVAVDTVAADVDEENGPKAALTPAAEPTQVSDQPLLDHTTSVPDKDVDCENEVSHPSANGELKVYEKDVAVDSPVKSNQNDIHTAASETASSNAKENAPKKSYASIVHELKENNAPFIVKAAPVKPPVQTRAAPPPPEAPAPVSNSASEKNNDVKGYSIFVGKLPMNATQDQLREVFEKFGSIKADGIQVRSNKQQGFCFGFVQFESSSSMIDALQASDVTVGGRRVSIEEAKKNRDNSDRGRFPMGRGGYRNDNFRGRGGYGGGRGYVRNDFEKRGEFTTARNRRNGEVYQNGGGRGAARQAVDA